MKAEANSAVVGALRAREGGGFVVVIRYAGHRFKSVRTADQARGWRADEMWLFGCAATRAEEQLCEACYPMVAMLPAQMVHRIPLGA
jgi:hypothetical protein